MLKCILILSLITLIIIGTVYLWCYPSIQNEFFKDQLVFKAPPSLTAIKGDDSTDFAGGKLIETSEDVIKRIKEISTASRKGYAIGSKNIKGEDYVLNKGNLLNFPEYFSVWDKWPGCLPEALFQGNCGSCWAFAAVTCLSSRFYIESCGNTGCYNYPQVNQQAMDLTLSNMDMVYNFRKVSLEKMDALIDINKNGFITEDEWVESVKQAHHDVLYNIKKRYNSLQLLLYMLNFQSLGSIDFKKSNHNINSIVKRAQKTFRLWSKDNKIDLKDWNNRLLQRPISLSAEKMIACCGPDCYDPSKSLFNKGNKDSVQLENNPQCSGGTLVNAWKILRDTGTPTSLCVGYNLDDWKEGEPTKNCKELLGPNFGYCSGYMLNVEKWDENLQEIIEKSEETGLEPIAFGRKDLDKIKIPPNKNTLPWGNQNLFTFRAKNAYEVNDDMLSIQREIIERGPVTTGFHVYDDFQYKFGSKGLGGQKHNPERDEIIGGDETNLIYMHLKKENEKPIGGHAITITGWGTYKNIPYWVCLNSWGVDFGTSGYTSIDNRNGLPYDMDGGGYFWFVRGINNCDFEKNVVAGQPNLYNISYPETVSKYGWGLQFPDLDDVKLISPHKNNEIKSGGITLKIDENIFREGGSSYIKQESKNNWIVKSMEVPSPFVLFWPEERPRYLLGYTEETLSDNVSHNTVKIEEDTIRNVKKVLEKFKHPLITINGEQLQIESYTGNKMKLVRGVSDNYVETHPEGSEINIFPWKGLSITDLEFLEPSDQMFEGKSRNETDFKKYYSPTIPPEW